MPDNTSCTFSPTALKYYNKYPKVTTHHLQSLGITTAENIYIKFDSITKLVQGKLLDYHKFIVVRPSQTSTVLTKPIAHFAKNQQPLTRSIVHQRLAHCNPRKLDTMCKQNTLQGLPTTPFPQPKHECPICLMSKFSHPPKGKTIDTNHIEPGELLHIDFSFWDTQSHRGFTTMLLIIDAKTRMLWLFCSSSKRAPIQTLEYFFRLLHLDNKPPKTIRVDEDGALARNFEFNKLLLQQTLTLETTGGYASFLNGKVERPNRTIADMTRALYFNAGHSPDKWCYAAETAADIYRFTLHSALGMSPYEAWYHKKPSIHHLRIWGCTVYVQTHSPPKSQPRVQLGYFMGFTKSRSLIRWLDPTTNTVKHTTSARFDELQTYIPHTTTKTPGTFLLEDTAIPPTISPLEVSIDLTEHPFIDSPLITIYLHLPPIGQYLGCTIGTCPLHNLPFFAKTTPGTLLAQQLQPYGPHNATFWILSCNSTEFSSAQGLIEYLKSTQQPSLVTNVQCIIAKRKPTTKTTIEEHRAIFNQIHLTSMIKSQPNDNTSTNYIVLPIAKTVVSSPTRPPTPNHVGELSRQPLFAEWKSALFKNYDKMLHSGTWSAPILRSSIPPEKTVLPARVTFKVKDTNVENNYELYCRTCANGSTMKENVDYQNSYSPVGSIDSIRLLLSIAASRRWILNALDISNAFQTSIIFDPDERTYLSLPPFYLEWFTATWPDYKLPSTNIKELVIQCLRAIQGTRDAGNKWYTLLLKKLLSLGLTRCTIDHGVFLWTYNNIPSILVLETDDILMASANSEPFHHLKTELEKMFDLTTTTGSTLKFLNLRLIQTSCGISFDQTSHITNQILKPYFKDIPPASIPSRPYPFPIDPSFEQQLYEAPPLTGIDLLNTEKTYKHPFNHLVGQLMHIATISRPDLSYACMRFSGYMACPNAPIFEALHHCLCYLYHHPHLPILYPANIVKSNNTSLQTFWSKGHAEYLPPDLGDELTTFTDADHARCLRTRRSVSVYYILYNTVLVSWGCKKQPVTAIHSTGSEITALYKGASKTLLLRTFLSSIGFPIPSSTPIYEDNQGTIKLIRTHRLTDTVRHYAVKIAWLNEQFLHNHLHTAYTKTSHQLADCSTKPINGSQLFLAISYAIGQRYYPLPDHPHYTLLDLQNYSYLKRQTTINSKLDKRSIQHHDPP